MANRSKVIIPENENNHKSRLIKSFQAIENLEDYTIKPEGVWGSTATIKIVYEEDKEDRFNRGEKYLYTSKYDVEFNSDTLDFEFNIPFDDNLEANEGEIVIYNLSRDTIAILQKIIKQRDKNSKKEVLTIEAGYEGDTGVIFKGYMTKVFTNQEGVDKVTTIKIVNDIECKENLELSESGNASTILNKLIDMLVSKTNLTKAKIKLARDHTYSESVSIDKSLESAIKDFSEVCGVSTIISKGNIYCCKLSEMDDVGVFDVSEDTGMIDSPQPFTEEISVEDETYTVEGFEIDMLLQHRMSVGAVINLKSRDYSGTYYVQSGEHTFNESESVTRIKVVEVK